MHRYRVTIDGVDYTVELTQGEAGDGAYVGRIGEQEIAIRAPGDSVDLDWAVVDGHAYELLFDHDLRWMQSHLGHHVLAIDDLDATVARAVGGDGRVKAPIPGLIARVMVEPEQEVVLGQPLVLLEAMKMENEIRSPQAGLVRQIHVRTGQTVILDQVLVEIEAAPDGAEPGGPSASA